MGDRAYCILKFRGSDKEAFDRVLAEHSFEPNEDDRDPDLDLWAYAYEEVNYAEMDAKVRDDLSDYDYDWIWEAGGNYTAGVTYHRAEGGELTLYESDEQRLNTIKECLDACKRLGQEEFIRQYSDCVKNMTVTPLEKTLTS